MRKGQNKEQYGQQAGGQDEQVLQPRTVARILLYLPQEPDVGEIDLLKTPEVEEVNENGDEKGEKREEESRVYKTHTRQRYELEGSGDFCAQSSQSTQSRFSAYSASSA